MIYIARYLKPKDGGGGRLRSEQIAENLNREGAETVVLDFNRRTLIRSLLLNPFLIKRMLPIITRFAMRSVSLRGLIDVSFIAWHLVAMLEKKSERHVYLEVAPGVTILLMEVFHSLEYTYTALPQNIEYLVPGPDDKIFRTDRSKYQYEIAGYRNARDVYCISEFDRHELDSKGIKAQLFPYFPPEHHAKMLSQVSLARQRGPIASDELLVLGSADNMPTFDGMRKLLRECNAQKLQFDLVVAGNGTEKLAEFESDGIAVLGRVSESKLKELMIRCSGLIVNQVPTSGFLTRIVDFNLAGIPIFVFRGYVQAQSLEEYGIFIIDGLNEVEEKLAVKDTCKSWKKFQRPSLAQLPA